MLNSIVKILARGAIFTNPIFPILAVKRDKMDMVSNFMRQFNI